MLPIEQIEKAKEVLENKGVILYPTDTVWGLGCKFDCPTAYQRLLEIKRRDQQQTFILIVESIGKLKEYVNDIHPRIETLLFYHDRPLTLIYRDHHGIPPHCLAPDGSVAIRVVNDPMCRELTRRLGCPITSTSANIKGQPTPQHFGEIQSDVLSQVDFVFDYKRTKNYTGSPSVIASFDKKGELVFHRE
jgi:L-threonylcarbamoyladenylate synthase